MASDIVVIPSPLRAERQMLNLPVGETFAQWLEAYVRRSPYRLGEPVLHEHGDIVQGGFDFTIEDGRHYLLVFRPAAPLVAAFEAMSFWQIVATTLVSMAISAVVSLIFRPKKPASGNTPEPSPVYSLSNATNTARLGEPIPVVYGSVVQVPPLAAQPYSEFVQNDQFISEILCVGQGYMLIDEVLIGDSTISGLPPGVVSWWPFMPDRHNQVFGTIQGSTGVLENVVTSREVADQELLASNQVTSSVPSTWYWRATNYQIVYTAPPGGTPLVSQLPVTQPGPALGTLVTAIYGHLKTANEEYWQLADYVVTAMGPPPYPATSVIPGPTQTTPGTEQPVGWFDMTKPGQHGSRAMLDFVFPGGLFTQKADGTFQGRALDVRCEFRPIDDSGNVTGGITTSVQNFNAQTNTPQRYTRTIDLPAAARWQCRCTRITPSDGKTSTSDRVLWTGLKLQVSDVAAGAPAYGEVSLLVIRIKASNGIASDAAASVRCRTTRRLKALADPAAALLPTSNPADAFADILTANYGAARPRDVEIDLDTLAARRSKWAGRNGFNAVFDQRSTVWEALQLAVQSVFSAPLPLGQKMTIVDDDKKPTRVGMFSEQNIVPGTLSIGYEFDKVGTPTGTRVEFRDPISFKPDFVILPDGATDTKAITLFGCTDRTVATQHAQLDQNRQQLQRKSISFDTELEGMILRTGDRFAVAHQLARWGQSARLLSAQNIGDGSSKLVVDAAFDWTIGASFAVLLRDPQGTPFQINGAWRGEADNEVMLPGVLPDWLVGQPDSLEPTHVLLGDTVRQVTDWIVTNMEPRDEPRVAIEGVNYAEAIYPW